MQHLFSDIREDQRRYHHSPDPLGAAAAVRTIWSQPGFQAVVAYRLGRWLRGLHRRPAAWALLVPAPVFWLAYLLFEAWVRSAYDIRLDQSAEVGAGLYIGHFGGIRVGGCRIGRHCAIQQEVRILPADRAASGGPDIGDRVWIGAHATIVGAQKVAAGATIGAGAVVTGDVGERCLVLGNPARVARWDYDNSPFL